MKVLIAVLLFLFPTCIVRWILILSNSKMYKLERGSHIGFSLVYVDKLAMRSSTNIGHLNYINTQSLCMMKGARIGALNYCKGSFEMKMAQNSRMNHTNKVSKSGKSYRISTLFLGKNVNLNVGQTLDMTDDITILDNTILAGLETNIWTHSFYVSKSSGYVARIDKSVIIGRNCYIGSRCTILPGVRISDGVTVGAHVCVSKDLDKSGLYVSQPCRFINFDSDEKISSLKEPGS